jgi:hypothetical protein
MSYTIRVSRAQCEAILEALIKHPPQAPVCMEETIAALELDALVQMLQITLQEPEDPQVVHAFVI